MELQSCMKSEAIKSLINWATTQVGMHEHYV